MKVATVQEVQGLYGPFSVSEKIIQKIWLQGEFHQAGLQTSSGKDLKVRSPGIWNMNEGPDFKEARLEIGGEEVIGDVEIHFYANDWFNHGHDTNPNFDRVILHVFLYPDATGYAASKCEMESLVLMPLLERDLEEFAMEAALLDLEQVNELEWFGRFMERSLAERRALLDRLAAVRWEQKVGYSKKRLACSNWSDCCHASTLEVMGYARNRSTMHKIAECYSREDFSTSFDAEEVYREFRAEWKLSGCRPANHPKLRLQQYARICAANPNWPDQLRSLLETAEFIESADPAAFRKTASLKDLETRISQEVFQGVLGSKRLNTLLCDAIFPLAAAAFGEEWAPYWQHWYPGDFPDSFARFYQQAGLGESRVPMSNGQMQGILALFVSKGEALD